MLYKRVDRKVRRSGPPAGRDALRDFTCILRHLYRFSDAFLDADCLSEASQNRQFGQRGARGDTNTWLLSRTNVDVFPRRRCRFQIPDGIAVVQSLFSSLRCQGRISRRTSTNCIATCHVTCTMNRRWKHANGKLLSIQPEGEEFKNNRSPGSRPARDPLHGTTLSFSHLCRRVCWLEVRLLLLH
jgi:hypothetical protein